MASFNICGKTLHSTLRLPIQKNRDLQGASLQQLQLKMQGKHYLIIDEMPMIGHRMMAWVDKRLHQASGNLDTPLGGFCHSVRRFRSVTTSRRQATVCRTNF